MEYIKNNTTHVYFVRHAQPNHSWEDDRTRPLTEEGIADSARISETFNNITFHYAVSSPYKRSVGTIEGFLKKQGLSLVYEERFRERKSGLNGNNFESFNKRWADFDYCEEGGECLAMVQMRNIEALKDILSQHKGENIIVGTHGTALSTILNYYNPEYNAKSFLRIIDFMPYIIRLDFDGDTYMGQEELLIIKKKFENK